jgi:AcrR family transcriptional regulator
VELVTDKPLRKDAERNRKLILEAAEELFIERGLGVTLNDIAHHAGVGVGTVYRRFPDKDQLIEGLFERRLEEMVDLMQRALDDPDPWNGLVSFLEGALELQSRNFALKDLILGTSEGLDSICKLRDRLLPLGQRLIRRAQDAGELRPDFEPSDMPLIQLMVSAIIDGARDVDPELWRRFLQIVLQGLRANPTPPKPLPHPALPHDQIQTVMSRAKLARR